MENLTQNNKRLATKQKKKLGDCSAYFRYIILLIWNTDFSQKFSCDSGNPNLDNQVNLFNSLIYVLFGFAVSQKIDSVHHD